jgi:hypothetical protein
MEAARQVDKQLDVWQLRAVQGSAFTQAAEVL